MLRRLVAALILVPLALLSVAFAVANRQQVVISFDPFDTAHPAVAIGTWLFVPIFVALIVGVVIGGVATWIGQGRWRSAARRIERELQQLRGKIAAMEHGAHRAAPEPAAPREAPPPPLRLKAPVQ